MIRRFCDRDGRAIGSEAFVMAWTDGSGAAKQSDLCKSCHDELVAWFGKGNPDPEAVLIAATELQSAEVVIGRLQKPDQLPHTDA